MGIAQGTQAPFARPLRWVRVPVSPPSPGRLAAKTPLLQRGYRRFESCPGYVARITGVGPRESNTLGLTHPAPADIVHPVERRPCKSDARGSRPRVGSRD